MSSFHEEISRCLFRESNDALFLFDPKNHRVLDVNPAALRLTGLDKSAACALRIGDLFSGAEPDDLDRLIDAYRRTGFYHSREGYCLAREVGEPIPVNISVSRIHTKPEPMGMVVARDITERIRAQEALRESEARYRGLVETARLIIWSVSADGRITSLNPAFEAITGWPQATWVGQAFVELIHPEDLPAARESFVRTLRGEVLPPYELRIRSASGADLTVEVLSAARQSGGDRPDVSGIARDVTERRQAEEASRRAEAMRGAKEATEAADRAKGEFLGHISHEIRTPMTAVLGFTDLLLGDERVLALPDDLLDGLRTIKQSGSHLLSLIDDLLDLTKINAGRLRIDRSPCSPGQIVGDVVAALRPRAEAKGLSLALEVAPEVPGTVRTDPVRLRQILINLLSNAIKFTREGDVRIGIGLERGPDEGPTLRVEVVDTGVGISDAEVGRLFEPFYSSDARAVRESGAGLGLAISRRMAGLLGGRITVRSRPGMGSTFTLRLPVEETGPTRPTSPDLGALAGSGPSPPLPSPLGGRLLLAEDNESIRRFVALRLQQDGVEVVAVGDGQEAVDQALAARDAGRPFDWILMDVQMPVLDGYGAARELRSRDYTGPIIALTAYASEENREECLQFGCDDHVSKPVAWGRLMEVLSAQRERMVEAGIGRPPVVK